MPDGERILVVDDDASLRRFLGVALERAGFSVAEAADGAGAVRTLFASDDHGVDAVLLDAVLPDVRGADLARRLLAVDTTAQTPVCFFSGALRTRASSPPGEGGIGWVPKPATPSQIISELERLIAWARAGGSPAPERHASLDAVASLLLI